MSLTNKLAGFINGEMTKFLSEISKEYGIDESELQEKWSNFTGVKKSVKKNTVKKVKEKKPKGPTIKELKEKLKNKGLKTSGKKEELLKRLNESDDDENEYNSWTIKKLRGEMKKRKIRGKTGDKKKDLVKYLMSDDNCSSCSSDSDSDSDSDVSLCNTCFTTITDYDDCDDMCNRCIKKLPVHK